jgi:hypothetical protein
VSPMALEMKTRCSASHSRARPASGRVAAEVGAMITAQRYARAALVEGEFWLEAALLFVAVAVDLLGQLDDGVLQLANGGAKIVDVRASILRAAVVAAAALEDSDDVLSHGHGSLLGLVRPILSAVARPHDRSQSKRVIRWRACDDDHYG